jgi:hypothetical protein
MALVMEYAEAWISFEGGKDELKKLIQLYGRLNAAEQGEASHLLACTLNRT